MHRAFLIDDIVHTVLQNVKPSASDLISFACTSSASSSPALDILWRVQSSLGPLIMCLPPDTWEIRDDNVVVSDIRNKMDTAHHIAAPFPRTITY